MTNRKDELLPEAERLFIHEYMPAAVIARKLNLNRKTINNWRAIHEWDKKRAVFLKSKVSFHEELYEFARKLMKDISSDMDAGEKVDPGRMYAFTRLIPMFVKARDYEESITKKEKSKAPKGLTADTVRKIEEEVLGIIHNEINEAEDESE